MSQRGKRPNSNNNNNNNSHQQKAAGGSSAAATEDGAPPVKRRKGRPPGSCSKNHQSSTSNHGGAHSHSGGTSASGNGGKDDDSSPVYGGGVGGLASTFATASSSKSWQPKPHSDMKSIYNRSAPEAPAELFRKDLISAMKLPDSEPLSPDEYWLIVDQWKQEWERGVQVPVNPDSLPEPCVNSIADGYIQRGRQDFKLLVEYQLPCAVIKNFHFSGQKTNTSESQRTTAFLMNSTTYRIHLQWRNLCAPTILIKWMRPG